MYICCCCSCWYVSVRLGRLRRLVHTLCVYVLGMFMLLYVTCISVYCSCNMQLFVHLVFVIVLCMHICLFTCYGYCVVMLVCVFCLRSVFIISNREISNWASQILKANMFAYLSVLSQISNCQGLGRKNKHETLKTDRIMFSRCLLTLYMSRSGWDAFTAWSTSMALWWLVFLFIVFVHVCVILVVAYYWLVYMIQCYMMLLVMFASSCLICVLCYAVLCISWFLHVLCMNLFVHCLVHKYASEQIEHAEVEDEREDDEEQGVHQPWAQEHIEEDDPWLQTNGVSTNGATAKVTNVDRLWKKVCPGTSEKIKVG